MYFYGILGSSLPSYYQIKEVHGFVSDLLVSDDPEYKWIDKIRTPRATNEARHRLFSKLSGELQRKIGKKVCFLRNFCGNFVFSCLFFTAF